MLGVICHAELFDGIGETHDAETDGAILIVGLYRLRDRQLVDVDEIVELADGKANSSLRALPN